MGKRELVALLYSSSWCLVVVEWLFLVVPQGCLRFVIVVFPVHTHLLFLFLEVYFLDLFFVAAKMAGGGIWTPNLLLLSGQH